MYTTLARLKDARACIPGYTRMLSFFSTASGMKDVPIPLFMIPIIGESDDCTWALDHAAVFDRADYDRFYRTHFWTVLDRVFGRQFNNHFNGTGEVAHLPQAVQDAIFSYFQVKSVTDALAWYDRWSMQSGKHWIWDEVLSARQLRVPRYFIKEVLESLSDHLPDDYQYAVARTHLGLPAIFCTRASTLVEESYEEDSSEGDEDSDEDEDEGPVSDSEDGDEDVDDEPGRTTRGRAVPAKKRAAPEPEVVDDRDKMAEARQTMRRLMRMSSGSMRLELQKLGVRTRYNLMYEARRSVAENMTRMLTCGDDPYPRMVQFIVDNKLPDLNNVKGFMLSQADDKEPPGYHLSFNTADPRTIFRIFHLLKARDLDIVELFGVNQLAREVSDATRGMGNVSAHEFDQLQGQRDENNRVVLSARQVDRVVPAERLSESEVESEDLL